MLLLLLLLLVVEEVSSAVELILNTPAGTRSTCRPNTSRVIGAAAAAAAARLRFGGAKA